MDGIRRALVLDLVLIAGTAIEQDPSVGPHNFVDKHSCLLPNNNWLYTSLITE